jgi:hypothetical protein
MSVDEFYSPKIVKNNDAIYTLLVRLLQLEPGSIQSHPEMGVGIVSKYRFGEAETVAEDLKTELEKQISTYLPHLVGVEVRAYTSNKILFVEIEVNNTLYKFEVSKDSDSIKLSDIYN